MDFDVYVKMQYSMQPPRKVVTIHEKNPENTSAQLLNAVNGILSNLNVDVTRTTVDKFGEAKQERVVLQGTFVEVWFYSEDDNTFMGQLKFANSDETSGLVIVKGRNPED